MVKRKKKTGISKKEKLGGSKTEIKEDSQADTVMFMSATAP